MILLAMRCASAVYRLACSFVLAQWRASVGDRTPVRQLLVRRYEAARLFSGHLDLIEADRYLNRWYRD